MIQGFAVAMRLGLSLGDLQATVGVHPTCAEELVKLKDVKRKAKTRRRARTTDERTRSDDNSNNNNNNDDDDDNDEPPPLSSC